MRRFGVQSDSKEGQGDMTPMIDMTFQLIAFFMVVINFAGADQNEQIHLPESELAKPPDAPLEFPITLQLTKKGTVILAGEETGIGGIGSLLLRERQVLEQRGHGVGEAIVVIRADSDAKTGRVQELIKVCQERGFERFALRAKQKAPERRRG